MSEREREEADDEKCVNVGIFEACDPTRCSRNERPANRFSSLLSSLFRMYIGEISRNVSLFLCVGELDLHDVIYVGVPPIDRTSRNFPNMARARYSLHITPIILSNYEEEEEIT